jgi:Ca2+-binding RTX toxin-like protein
MEQGTLNPGGTMKLRTALAVALVLPSTLALAGPVAPSYAAAMCQGQVATIEATGTITGTDGNDVIVATGINSEVDAKAGNDLICTDGGRVFTGPGDDSVLSTATSANTEANLFGGSDSYVSVGTGASVVYADELTGLHADLGSGGGSVWLYPTSTPGTGTVDAGPHGGTIFAIGETEAHVDLVRHTAGVDDLFTVSIANVRNAEATGVKVRLTGDDAKNRLYAYGCDTVLIGGDGKDVLSKIGNGFDIELPPCHRFRSLLKGGNGPDRMVGRDGNDVMLGGRGHDIADGSGGNDRCVVEVALHCER